MATKVEWAKNPDGNQGESLNIVTGCSKVSPGCKKCYAERMAKRLRAMGQEPYQNAVDEKGWTGEIGFVEERLSVPDKWRKPRTVFLNRMSDTFHEGLEQEQVFKMLDLFPETDREKEILKFQGAWREFGRALLDTKPGELVVWMVEKLAALLNTDDEKVNDE